MKFSIKDFFSVNVTRFSNLFTITEEILNGKLHFLFSDNTMAHVFQKMKLPNHLYTGREWNGHTQPAITCSKLTVETLEQGIKYAQR